jgi:hypothetical protein
MTTAILRITAWWGKKVRCSCVWEWGLTEGRQTTDIVKNLIHLCRYVNGCTAFFLVVEILLVSSSDSLFITD